MRVKIIFRHFLRLLLRNMFHKNRKRRDFEKGNLSLERKREGVLRIVNKGVRRITAVLQGPK